MVDINPGDSVAKFSPRQPTLVDAVAETKRVSDQLMRSNPMENAVVTKGLTTFVGNYGGDFAWFGEFYPADANLTDDFGGPEPQRGVVIQRDDPQQNFAYVMYDPHPQAGVPLRQRVAMYDADGRRTWMEGDTGGQHWPRHHIPVYPRNAYSNATSQEIVASGSSTLVGRHLQYGFIVRTFPLWPVQGAPGFGNVNVPLFRAGADAAMRVEWQLQVSAADINVFSPVNSVGPASTSVGGSLDLSPIFDERHDFISVVVHGRISAGDASRNAFAIVPGYFHNLTE
jgi:hypothetical protein